ncbi:glycosyltransferase family 2 protein [Priestia megaterium]|uniref:glycosyltransferase family 2 protein n=1 Tax=Priestia megaterium TaxID=1404 RepID=UPI00101CE45A|nr:glycosyltransferase family 2 protein [Priestia megaterium]
MEKDNLPLVSIITPSYNQGKFIQETIESVLTQDYPNIEYIVVDGASTDNTIDTLEKISKSESRLRFVSEPDRGQGHAVNKGIEMANGKIIGWLNSDDTYFPGVIKKVVELFNLYPSYGVVYGKGYHINEKSEIINSYPVKPYKNYQDFFDFNIICQPAAFFRKEVFQAVNGIDESLYFTLDYDLWIRISKRFPLKFTDDYLANSRLHPDAKTLAAALDRGLPEILYVSNKHFGTVSNKWLYHFLTHHNEVSAHWYLHLFKKFNVFGNSPKVASTNLYQDSWTGPELKVDVEVYPSNPLKTILIKGENLAFDNLVLYVYLDNNFINKYKIEEKSFILELPIYSEHPSKIKIKCIQQFIPSELRINSDSRTLSFIVKDLILLSHREHDFYTEFQKGSKRVCEWLRTNRT